MTLFPLLAQSSEQPVSYYTPGFLCNKDLVTHSVVYYLYGVLSLI